MHDDLEQLAAEVEAVNAQGVRYCKQCSYDLRALPAGICPECGRAFDPDDRHTFKRSDKGPDYPIIIPTIFACVIGPLLMAAAIAANFDYWSSFWRPDTILSLPIFVWRAMCLLTMALAAWVVIKGRGRPVIYAMCAAAPAFILFLLLLRH